MRFEKGLPCVALSPYGTQAEALKNLVYCPVWNVPSDSSLPLWIPLAWTLLACVLHKLEVCLGQGFLVLMSLWGHPVPCRTSIPGFDPLFPALSPTPSCNN